MSCGTVSYTHLDVYKRQGIYNGGEDTGPSYEIPGEALDDPAFAALMEDATKYIGWPRCV